MTNRTNRIKYLQGYRATHKKEMVAWRIRNKERLKRYKKGYYEKNKSALTLQQKGRRDNLKKLVFDHYGRRCNCPKCPTPDIDPLFLTIDHINNDGYKERGHKNRRGLSTTSIYLKIIRTGFPDTYQVLCWNCNCGKRLNNGICPHLTL